MRISGGDARGIKLKVPKGIRPASERVRQAVFSSLGHRVLDARVLDLYCGSGAYGLDALSRGAEGVVFVDTDPDACRQNVSAAGYADVSKIRRSDVSRYLVRTGPRDAPFDLIFADPPYARTKDGSALDVDVLDALADLLTEDGCVVWESRWSTQVLETPHGWVVEADRRYGDTRVTMLKRGAG